MTFYNTGHTFIIEEHPAFQQIQTENIGCDYRHHRCQPAASSAGQLACHMVGSHDANKELT